jgi:hypothetical protein
MAARLVWVIGLAAGAALTGCSSTPATPSSTTPTASAAGSVSIDNKDSGPVSSVTCQSQADGLLAITVESTPRLSMLLTGNGTVVNYISMGGSFHDTGLTYVVGSNSSGMEVHLSRTGQTFTVTGTGIGHVGDSDKELLVPFTIVATCP